MSKLRIVREGELCTGTLNIAGTDSFRASSSKVFGTYGVNIQNAPELFRSTIVARPGHCLIQTDQGGAEARVTAYEANCAALIRCFEAGIKPYIPMALNIFIDKFRGKEDAKRYQFRDPLELKELPEWSELSKRIKDDAFAYPLGKQSVLAFNYEMGWPTFQVACLLMSGGSIRLSNEMAKDIRNIFFHWAPEIKVWQVLTKKRIQEEGVLYNLLGHPRFFIERITESYLRAGISWVPQSSVGEISHNAAVELTRLIPGSKYWLHVASNIHDALLCEVPLEHKDVALSALEYLLGPDLVTTDGKRKFKMAVESKVGNSWYVPPKK